MKGGGDCPSCLGLQLARLSFNGTGVGRPSERFAEEENCASGDSRKSFLRRGTE